MLYLILSVFIIGSVNGQCEERCFPNLECFTNCPPWQEFPLPNGPEQINTQFQLYTQDNRGTAEVITPESLGSYDGRRGTTFFIAHGFTEDGQTEWVQNMKNGLLDRGDHNVVVIDWADGALPDLDRPFEPVPASNSRVVARQTRNLVNAMVSNANLQMHSTHCIGFSVGGHLCGFLGKERRTVNRISGLDPAGTIFDRAESRIRLDSGDATFVDVSHTNAIGEDTVSGINRAVGHVDFWPNQGRTQPACRGDITPGVCSHAIAPDYFVESLSGDCDFTSRQCVDEDQAKNGQCPACSNSDCQHMGWGAHYRPGRGNFQLETNASPPYCIN